MFRFIKSCIFVALIVGFFTGSSYFFEKKHYTVYETLYDFRRLTPDLFPHPLSLKIISSGHFATHADMLWIGLIQFIGDNIGNGKYLDFSHHILSNITSLSPYFGKAYETDLLFTPLVYADSLESLTNDEKNKIERAMEHGKKGMEVWCDQNKLKQISDLPYGNELWSREDLKNPCDFGMVPYYIGVHYGNDLLDYKNAAYYYKIASMQDDAPDAARFLGPIALANSINPNVGALSLLYIALQGYDIAPFSCQKYASSLITRLTQSGTITSSMIREIEDFEMNMEDTKDDKELESYSVTNCHDNLRRAIKHIYLAYITEVSAPYPEITLGQELIDKGLLTHIPFLSSQQGFKVRKIAGRWQFRTY